MFTTCVISELAKHATHTLGLQYKSWQLMSTIERLWHDFDHAPKGICNAPATRAVEESLTDCGVWPAGEV